MTSEEYSIIASDGKSLFGRSWQVSEPKAIICLVHGLGEHSGRYEHVADFFVKHNCSFFTFDLRGHGLSEGKRGHAASMDILLDDVEELMKYAREVHNDCPMFLYGHSLGGNIVTNFVLKQNTCELTGAVISSPWLKLAKEPPAWKISLAAYVSKIFPSFTQSNGLDIANLTSLDEVNQAYKNDPLVHDQISTRLFIKGYRSGIWALENADRLKVPVLMFHGSEDNITSQKSSQAFAEKVGDLASYKTWPGTRHEPHNDRDRDAVLARVHQFIVSHVQ